MKIPEIIKKLTEFFRTRKKLLRVTIMLVAFIPAFMGAYLGYSGAMRSVDYMFEDATYQKGRNEDPDIVVIPVTSDDKLFNANALDIGTLAELIEALNADPDHRPAAIGVASVVRSVGDSSEDAMLISAVQNDNVVLGDLLNFSERILVGDESCVEDSFYVFERQDPDMIFNSLCQDGYLNITADTDGIIRSYFWNAEIGGKKIKSFAESVYDVYCRNTGIADADKFVPNYSEDGFTMIPFCKAPGGFDNINYKRIVEGTVNPDAYSGKIVIIGTADSALSAGYTTAISRTRTMYNCDIQANMISNLLDHRSLMQVPLRIQLLILILVTWAMTMIVIELPFIYSVIAAAVCLTANFVLAPVLWDKGWSIHPLYYLATMIVALFVSIFVHIEKLRAMQVSDNEILRRYLDQNVIDAIIKHHRRGGDIESSGKSKNVAVLFADIRGFTGISEELGPENTVNLLNDFLSSAEECIHAHGGTVDKFIGDCIMAFWEDTEDNKSVIPDACRAALEIVGTIHEKEDYYFRTYKREITFGIGVDYGEAIVGDIGSVNRKDYTLVGNAVNLASRLESNAPKGMVLISQHVYDAVKSYASCQNFGQKLRVRGFAQQVNAYILNSISDAPAAADNGETVSMYNAEDDYVLYTFGTRGSFPVTGRRYSEFGGSTTCFVIKHKDHALVYDCGTGLLEAHEVLSDCSRIDVVLSHMHYDHCMGLLSWYSVFPKDAEINFYGNFGAWFGRDTLKEFFRTPFWPVDYTGGITDNIHSIEEFGGELLLDDDITVSFFDSPHPNGTSIVRIRIGSRVICIMVDCETTDGLPFDLVKNADILIYDGMLDDSEYEGKAGWGHSTWQQAVELAKKAQVGQLIVTHHSPDAWDSELRMREKDAQKIFKNTEFARVGNKLVFRADD